MHRQQITQLPREDGADGLAVEGRKPLSATIPMRGMRTSSSVSRSSSGSASANSAPRASSTTSCDQKSIPNETSSAHGGNGTSVRRLSPSVPP
ncbi:MAG TPA: hypothetical protein VEK57_03500 [Thermoanaerobaculia bacterium]|nr:hypothetical protein [Thermoanaerobaculia bacterium]